MAEHISDPDSYGIFIVDRRFRGIDGSVNQLAQVIIQSLSSGLASSLALDQ